MKIGSLFSGGGGLDLAVHALWPEAQTVWCAETDAHAYEAYRRMWDVPNMGDLRAVDWGQVEPVDVLVGGYPCQPWSNAGKRKGQDDDRDGWPWFRDAISSLGPRLVLLENVRGHVIPAGAGRTVSDLADLGYDAVWTTLRASEVGAPHRRDRWFCVAYPNGVAGAVRGERPGRSGEVGKPGPVAGAFGFRSPPAIDPNGFGGERWGVPGDMAGPCGEVEGEAPQRERGRDAADDCRAAAAYPEVYEQREPPIARSIRAEPRHGASGVDWGDYWPAIDRWEHITGRPAPAPTDHQGRLNPPFVEWVMGWPEGHIDGLPRTAALRVLGNGVVPQQAVAAYGELLDAEEVAA